MIAQHIRQKIDEQLNRVESEEDIRILYAVESGSRAWGFPSQDSDYDVRFIYVHRQSWYLSIDLEHRRDVVERPCTDDIDLSGWDLRKALNLFARTNPPLYEWLDSPIVYLDRIGFADRLRTLTPMFYSPLKAMHHYLHMAQGNFRAYLQSEYVRLKKYLYVLRPILAACWIEQGRGAVPMRFTELVETLVDEPALRQAIEELVARKMQGDELEEGARIEPIHEFIITELPRLESVVKNLPSSKGDMEMLNEIYRETINDAWSENARS